MQFSQTLRNNQAEPQTLLFLQLALKLHVRAYFANVISLQSAALIADGHHQRIVHVGGGKQDLDRLACLGKLEGIMHELIHNFGQIFFRDGNRLFRQLHGQIDRPANRLRLKSSAVVNDPFWGQGLLFPQGIRPLRIASINSICE